MNIRILLAILAVFFRGNLQARELPKPFVAYPFPVGDYLKRIQQGKQKHAFNASKDFGQWQKQARRSLIDLTGLKQIEKDLAGFKPKISIGKAKETKDSFNRILCSIETEPGIRIPFYLLIPKGADPARQHSLLLCPHGHDKLGLHSYAGAFKDEKHRQKVLGKEGFIFHCDCCLAPKLRDWGDWKELGGLVAPRHLLLVHGVNDGLHHRPTIDKLGDQLKTIFKAAGAPSHADLKWGNSGHRFYPDKMWPFIDKALATKK